MTKILNEKYQNNKTDDKTSDERDQIRAIGKKKIIEDEETVQLKTLSTDIEKINRKEIDNVELKNHTLKNR